MSTRRLGVLPVTPTARGDLQDTTGAVRRYLDDAREAGRLPDGGISLRTLGGSVLFEANEPVDRVHIAIDPTDLPELFPSPAFLLADPEPPRPEAADLFGFRALDGPSCGSPPPGGYP